jgi:hypothetical protein
MLTTVDSSSWGWNRNSSYSDYLTTENLIHQLIETVAFNGNMLLDVRTGRGWSSVSDGPFTVWGLVGRERQAI